MSAAEFGAGVLRQMHSIAGRQRRPVRVDPFVAYLHPTSRLRFFTFAMLDPDAAVPSPAERAGALARLADAFTEAGHVPRFEHIREVAPWLEDDLAAAGFGVELETALLACGPDELRTVETEATLTTVEPATASDEEIHALLAVAVEAFGNGDPPDAARVASWREGASVGVLARVDGVPVAGGVVTEAVEGLSELAGIGTLASHRRRGLAGAITSALAREGFARGARRCFMTPGDEGAHRVYARAGFTPAGTMLALAADIAVSPPAAR